MSTAQGTVGNFKTIQLFLAIGIFILLIACLNFINLSTARSVERAKEIGTKVLGNDRKRLILQFLTEAAVLCTFAAIITIVLMVALRLAFNSFAGKSFTVSSLLTVENHLLLSGIIVVLVPLAGFLLLHSALSSFKPSASIKRKFSHSTSGALLRKSLVVLQFVISAGDHVPSSCGSR